MEWRIVGVVALGGVIGAEARYGLTRAWPAPAATVLVNVLGCALAGALLVVVDGSSRRWLQPFLGPGVLAGFTTFSTFAVDADRLLHQHRVVAAAAYVVGTVAACLAATVVAMRLTRAVRGAR